MIVKHHWRSQLAFLRQQLTEAPETAKRANPDHQYADLSGRYESVAGSALDLVDEIIKAAETED